MTTDHIRASELMRRDLRFRRIVDSVVANTLQEHGPIDPDRADSEARDIAIEVAALLLQQIYDGDAELLALRSERDHWRAAAERMLHTTPLQLVIPKKEEEK